MRGICGDERIIRRDYGVIPACAGNIFAAFADASASWGHPCVCGEYHRLRSPLSSSLGSSLRVRGILLHHKRASAIRRVIPACAGNMIGTAAVAVAAEGHPCVCGEYYETELTEYPYIGSSLRVRGI